jgi:hypothetical protein
MADVGPRPFRPSTLLGTTLSLSKGRRPLSELLCAVKARVPSPGNKLFANDPGLGMHHGRR